MDFFVPVGVPVAIKVLDLSGDWGTAHGAVAAVTARPTSIELSPFDFRNDGAWCADWEFAESEIVVASFSLSEVWRYNGAGSISNFLTEMLNRMRSNSIFVYVDNGGPNFSPNLDSLVSARTDFKLLASDERPEGRLGTDERRDVVETPFKARFGNAWTKMKGNVDTRVWQKI